MDKFREEVQRESNAAMKKKASLDPQASMGYGGKFGVESDRMDKSALGKKLLEIRKIILVFLINEGLQSIHTYIVTIPIDPNDYSFKDKMVAKRTYPTLEHF